MYLFKRLRLVGILPFFFIPSIAFAKISTPVETKDRIPFSFAISGGISLGSYEAGLNWIYVTWLKKKREVFPSPTYFPPVITSVSGASAGSINALLTAASWCRDPTSSDPLFPDTVSQNIFRNIWLKVDLSGLLPDDPGKYDETDSLLSRKPFDSLLEYLKNVLNAPDYREDCAVPMAFIVTRTKPSSISMDGISVDNDRFVIPILMKTKKEKETGKVTLMFEPFLVNRLNPSFGNIILLRVKKSGNQEKREDVYVPTEGVLEALKASSAFPFAFGQVNLKYCAYIKDHPLSDNTPSSDECPEGYKEDDSYFVDGGIFDNIPLGSAMGLGEPWRFDPDADILMKNRRRTTYLYMDPGNLRKKSSPPSPNNDRGNPSFGIIGESRFLGGALATGSNYELYNQLTSGAWNHRLNKITEKVIDLLRNISTTPGSNDEESCEGIYKRLLNSPPYYEGEIRKAIGCLNEWQEKYDCESSSFKGCGNDSRPDAEQLQTARRERIELLARLAENLDNKQLSAFIKSGAEDHLGDRRVWRSSRFAHLTGNYLLHFGAFLDSYFREFDYYAGVYDAIVNLSELECSINPTTKENCVRDGAKVREIYNALDIGADPDAAMVFSILAKKEFNWTWPQSSLSESKHNISVIASSMTSLTSPTDFKEFVNALKNNWKFTEKERQNAILYEIFSIESDEESELLYPLIRRGIDRLGALEEKETKVLEGYGDNSAHYSDMLHKTSIFGSLFAKSILGDDGSSRWNQGNATPNWLNLILPYEVNTDIINGGFSMAWIPRITLMPRWSLELKISPVGLDKFGKDTIWFSQIDTYLTYHPKKFLLGSFGIGPLVNLTWEKWQDYPRVNVGSAVFFNLLAEKFRLTIGARSFKHNFFGDNFYFTLGITDFQGIAASLAKCLF